eukprot:1192371-Prorocentrum_minimum.AAC.1
MVANLSPAATRLEPVDATLCLTGPRVLVIPLTLWASIMSASVPGATWPPSRTTSFPGTLGTCK